MEEIDIEGNGPVIDDRVQPFMWFGNETVDAWHVRDMGAIGFTIYFIITRFRSQNRGTAWPSAQTIADLTNLERKTVIKYRKELVKLGYIVPTPGGGGQEYRITDKCRSSASGCSPSVIGTPKLHQPVQTPKAKIAEKAGFVRFWASWPAHRRKTDRAGACASWNAKHCEPIAEAVIAAVAEFAQSRDWLKDNGDFIPSPRVWLNQRQWEGAKFIPSPINECEPLGEGRAPTDEDRRMLWGDD